jgi:hypothetical protein
MNHGIIRIFVNFFSKFLFGYIHYTGGIRSDNSNETYIVH